MATENSPGGSFYEVVGGKRLVGEVAVSGAKNAAIPAIVAACLSSESTQLSNIPCKLNDIRVLIELLQSVGAQVRECGDGRLICSGRDWEGGVLDANKAGLLRHSLLLLGAAARWGTPLRLPSAGGCDLGRRKHDLHVLGFRKAGFPVHDDASGLAIGVGTSNGDVQIEFHYPTFGGTLNVLFAAVCRSGITTRLHNAACNPEVLDVIAQLQAMGARISWPQPALLEIQGVSQLHGTDYRVMGDRMVAATMVAAAGVTGGHISISGVPPQVLSSELQVWSQVGLRFQEFESTIEVNSPVRLKPSSITTRPYPGFHTDIQPLHAVLMTAADGTSSIKETILDGRFRYAVELRKMGASIRVMDGNFRCANGVPGQIAKIEGPVSLSGAKMMAPDIRGGAALVVAALSADGASRVSGLYQLERGYADLPQALRQLGAQITCHE